MNIAYKNLKSNLEDVLVLIQLHEEKTGELPGRRYGVEVLNKSAVIMAVACWEAFIEDTAKFAFEEIINNSASYSDIPNKILKHATKFLKEDKHELKIWELSGDGWKSVLQNYKSVLIKKYLGPFNTPKPQNINNLYRELLAIDEVTACWKWNRLSNRSAKEKIQKFIEVRGAIAHRGPLKRSITKRYAEENSVLIIRLATKTANYVREHLFSICGYYPWDKVSMGEFS